MFIIDTNYCFYIVSFLFKNIEKGLFFVNHGSQSTLCWTNCHFYFVAVRSCTVIYASFYYCKGVFLFIRSNSSIYTVIPSGNISVFYSFLGLEGGGLGSHVAPISKTGLSNISQMNRSIDLGYSKR